MMQEVANRTSRHAGLTLLEVATSAAVLVVVAMSSVLMMLPIAKQARISREMDTGLMAAEEYIEGLQLSPFDTITTKFPPGQETSVDTLNEGKIVVEYADPDVDPLVVHVHLTWTSPDLGSMSRTFTTARTK